MKVNKHKLFIAISSIILYFILDFCFVYTIPGNYYEFIKIDRGQPGSAILILSYVVPILLSFLLIILPGSKLIFTIQVFMLIIILYPSTILLRHLNTDIRIVGLNVIYFFSLYIIGNGLKFRIRIPILKENQKVFFLLLISILLITPFIIIFASYVDLKNLLLINIYKSRDIETTLNNPYTGYLYSPLSNVILPLVILLSWVHKEYTKAIVALAMLIFMFLVGGHKSVFLGAFLIIFLYYGDYYRKIHFIILGSLVVVIAGILSYDIYNDFFLTSVTRRIFFLPAALDVAYFDFFDKKPIFWSDSVLRSFIPYPYTHSSRNLIGEHLLGNLQTNANNGIISDGFMNFGITGALINIFMVSVIYAILNSLHMSHRFFGLVFLMFFTFYSSYFFTSLLTHGVLLLILIAGFFLKNTQDAYDD